MAPLWVRACFKKSSLTRILTDIIRIEHHGIRKNIPGIKVCIECQCFHTTPFYLKRKVKETKFSPKIKAKSLMPLVDVWKNMTVKELATAASRSVSDVLEAISYIDTNKYTKYTVIENRNVLFAAVAKLGAKYRIVARPDKVYEEKREHDVVKRPLPDPSLLVKRHPVVTVMGHVDHGKTTLLDSLRHTSVVDKEFGGITQHIGAFNVNLDTGERITFLDTPGHAAFSAMRARGANVTDIVILVVAADDGVMEQTVQSIRMAREANVPIVVAINKIDKPEADIERTHRMLAENGISVEALGGDVPSVNISALKSTNLQELIDTVAAQAAIMDLKGDPKGLVEAVVLEVTTEVGRGKLATALIQRGTLRKGAILVCGVAYAKVRNMFDHAGAFVSEAKLSEAVQIIGWRELPSAGDEILEVEDEKKAHMVVKYREAQQSKSKALEALPEIEKKRAEHHEKYQIELRERRAQGFRYKKWGGLPQKQVENDDGIPRVNVIVKADVDGSAEAILDVLDTYGDEGRCHLDVIHYGIGPVSQNDVELADAFNAIIYNFNVSTPRNIQELADQSQISIHSHRVIYKLIDDVKNEIFKKLPPEKKEQILGEANVIQSFEINEKKKKINVAGCRCTDGILKKDTLYRVLRNDEIIYDGKLEAMRHLKNEVSSIKSGVECGLRFQDPTVIVKPGDTIICYTLYEVPAVVNWNPGF